MGGSRKFSVGLGALGLLAAFAILLFVRPGEPAVAQGTGGGATYVGVASCGGATCHGRSEGGGPGRSPERSNVWAGPSPSMTPPWRTPGPSASLRPWQVVPPQLATPT